MYTVISKVHTLHTLQPSQPYVHHPSVQTQPPINDIPEIYLYFCVCQNKRANNTMEEVKGVTSLFYIRDSVFLN